MAEWILQIHISVHEMCHYALKVLIQELDSKHHKIFSKSANAYYICLIIT